jgi:hypothetical protein
MDLYKPPIISLAWADLKQGNYTFHFLDNGKTSFFNHNEGYKDYKVKHIEGLLDCDKYTEIILILPDKCFEISLTHYMSRKYLSKPLDKGLIISFSKINRQIVKILDICNPNILEDYRKYEIGTEEFIY